MFKGLNIIEDINSKNEEDIKYIFIIDQIKFDDIDHDRSFEEMNNIRNYIKSSSIIFSDLNLYQRIKRQRITCTFSYFKVNFILF